jgi:signal peptidase II
MRVLSRSALVAIVLICCVGCDQVSKVAAREYLPGTGVHSYLGDTFRLVYAENPGAFLSVGASLPAAVRYSAFTIGVGALVAALLAWAIFSARLAWFQRLAIAAIGAGGVANLIDRIRYDGAVTDFLNLGIGSVRTGIFNVADAIVMLGLVGLLVTSRQRAQFDS